MEQLAKLGFTQSYTYFTWRNAKWELETYLTRADPRRDVADYFRPNFWPNTPDILSEELQTGGTGRLHRPSGPGRHPRRQLRHLRARLRAAGARAPRARVRGVPPTRRSTRSGHWDLDRPDSLAELHRPGQPDPPRPRRPSSINDALRFHRADNDQIIAYSKATGRDAGPTGDARPTTSSWSSSTSTITTPRSGWVDLDLDALGVDPAPAPTSCTTC